MEKILHSMMLILAALLVGCSNDEPNYNNDLPSEISSFVSEYYPNQAVADYTHNSDGYQVILKDGPTMDFNKDYEWTTINGNGSTLSRQLLYDQLPNALYEYIEQTEALNEVFGIERTDTSYIATLLKSTVTYNTSDGAITAS